MAKRKTPRNKQEGFIGIYLVKGGDRTLLDRFEQEIAADPELDNGKLVRLALKEYFERKDNVAQK
jgi:hypothetical protein